MRFVLKRLLLGFVLIALASAVLLLSDLGRWTAAARSVPHIGLLQHASTMLLDEGTRGAINGLAENGFVDGKTIVIESSTLRAIFLLEIPSPKKWLMLGMTCC